MAVTIAAETKRCPRCERHLPTSAFGRNVRRLQELRAYCRACEAAYARERRRQRPDSPEQRRRWQLSTKYGLTPEQFDQLAAAQTGACAICRVVPDEGPLHVDHDEVTGAVRGLLCGRCNRGIGLLDHDPGRLREAARYLEEAT